MCAASTLPTAPEAPRIAIRTDNGMPFRAQAVPPIDAISGDEIPCSVLTMSPARVIASKHSMIALDRVPALILGGPSSYSEAAGQRQSRCSNLSHRSRPGSGPASKSLRWTTDKNSGEGRSGTGTRRHTKGPSNHRHDQTAESVQSDAHRSRVQNDAH